MTIKPAAVKSSVNTLTYGIQIHKSVSVNLTTAHQAHTILKNLNVSASATPTLRSGVRKTMYMMNMKPVDVCVIRPAMRPMYWTRKNANACVIKSAQKDMC